MAIPAGTRLGPYEILSAIGAGGMGEVYKARDTRLERTVAIKVLPAHLADQPEVRERFEREAKTIASLNHPHICTLYDVGHQDGTDFLVMEYLEGETLATRLLKGPLPLDQVSRCAIEIADALDKAHRKGITHRDLKPGNIMLTKNGSKLLDFGLAKLKEAAAPTESVSQMPTLSHSPTAQGTLLGTMQYMAPEQVEGKNDEVDGRTDIFAFGAVVYEMATGKKAFEGKTNASVMSKIMQVDPPPISSLQPMTPPALERIVKRCLAKDPEDRWQTARDLELELKAIAEDGSQAGAVAAPARKATNWVAWASIAAVLVAAIVAGAIYFRPAQVASSVAPVQFTVAPPEDAQFDPYPWFASVSPDGSKLAFVARSSSGENQIWLRSLDSPTARPIPGTESSGISMFPFWSPDSRFLGFYDGADTIKKVPIAGGPAQTIIAGVAGPVTATWNQDGVIVFARRAVDGMSLYRVSAAGGEATAVPVPIEVGEARYWWPQFLPDGMHFLFSAGSFSAEGEKRRVYAGSLDSRDRKFIVDSDSSGQYVAPGYLLFTRQNTLMAQPFDAARLEVTGEAVPLVQGVQYDAQRLAAAFSTSQNGVLAYRAGASEELNSLVWVSRNGTEEPIAAPPHAYQQPRLSPDGRHMAVEIAAQLWVYDLTRQTLSRLTFQGTSNDLPIWTPDGQRIAFRSPQANNVLGIAWQMADGSGGREDLVAGSSAGGISPNSWSPDGQRLAFNMNGPNAPNGRDIAILSLADRKVTPFLSTKFNEGAPEFSPDGHWLAYMSEESGRSEVYVQPYPGPGGKWQISTDGGSAPKWNPSGRELFYRNATKMMAVDITTQPNFTAGRPKLLFDGPYLFTSPPLTFQFYDVSRDGQRFLMVKQSREAAQPINVTLNWIEEMKRSMPAGTN
jgi:eukaryotic-like serine/threonine-protein kinase